VPQHDNALVKSRVWVGIATEGSSKGGIVQDAARKLIADSVEGEAKTILMQIAR